MSQNPAEARHTVLADAGVLWLQAPLTHWSIEHGLPSLVHEVPLATLPHPQVPSANVVAPVHVAVWQTGHAGQSPAVEQANALRGENSGPPSTHATRTSASEMRLIVPSFRVPPTELCRCPLSAISAYRLSHP